MWRDGVIVTGTGVAQVGVRSRLPVNREAGKPGLGRRDRGRSGGFSTIETMAAASLGLTMMATVFAFQQAQLKASAAQNVYTESQAVTRGVIDLMSRELRMASYDPTGLAIAPIGVLPPGVKQGIVTATPTVLRFRADLNANGVIDAGAGEDVTYRLESGQIRRTDGDGTAVALVDNAISSGLTFLYFDNSNPPVQLVPAGSPSALTSSQRDLVAKVRVTVNAVSTLQTPRGPKPHSSVAESEIAIRNRSLLNF
jgi:type II secretory pathway component PulJ